MNTTIEASWAGARRGRAQHGLGTILPPGRGRHRRPTELVTPSTSTLGADAMKRPTFDPESDRYDYRPLKAIGRNHRVGTLTVSQFQRQGHRPP